VFVLYIFSDMDSIPLHFMTVPKNGVFGRMDVSVEMGLTPPLFSPPGLAGSLVLILQYCLCCSINVEMIQLDDC